MWDPLFQTHLHFANRYILLVKAYGLTSAKLTIYHLYFILFSLVQTYSMPLLWQLGDIMKSLCMRATDSEILSTLLNEL